VTPLENCLRMRFALRSSGQIKSAYESLGCICSQYGDSIYRRATPVVLTNRYIDLICLCCSILFRMQHKTPL